MENKYNQHTVLLTRLSDAPLHSFSQTMPRLRVCSVRRDVPMETRARKCKYGFAYAHNATVVCNWIKVKGRGDAKSCDFCLNKANRGNEGASLLTLCFFNGPKDAETCFKRKEKGTSRSLTGQKARKLFLLTVTKLYQKQKQWDYFGLDIIFVNH